MTKCRQMGKMVNYGADRTKVGIARSVNQISPIASELDTTESTGCYAYRLCRWSLDV